MTVYKVKFGKNTLQESQANSDHWSIGQCIPNRFDHIVYNKQKYCAPL